MSTSRLTKAHSRLGMFAGIAYVLLGLTIGLWPDYWDDASASDQVLFVVVAVGGGVLLLAGLRLFERAPWAAAAAVSVGAVAGAVPFYWSLVAPLLAVALVVLSVVRARRERGDLVA